MTKRKPTPAPKKQVSFKEAAKECGVRLCPKCGCPNGAVKSPPHACIYCSTPAPVAEVSAAKHELWVIEDELRDLRVGSYLIIHDGLGTVAFVRAFDKPDAPDMVARATAAEIVRRCNAFPDLVAALELAEEWVDIELRAIDEEDEAGQLVLTKLRAALAKVKP